MVGCRTLFVLFGLSSKLFEAGHRFLTPNWEGLFGKVFRTQYLKI
jgi:hypothetical protein